MTMFELVESAKTSRKKRSCGFGVHGENADEINKGGSKFIRFLMDMLKAAEGTKRFRTNGSGRLCDPISTPN